jgi:RimJ/RimL family protein N-acetyltransferase
MQGKPMNEMKKKAENETGEAAPALDWHSALRPAAGELEGRHVRVRPLDAARDAKSLWLAFAEDREGRDWEWLPYGPFEDYPAFEAWLEDQQESRDPLFVSLCPVAAEGAAGLASWMRFDPAMGVIEIGHIHLAPSLQRTRAATEALYLMMRQVFDAWGYRRLEWKCDALNEPSRRAAQRLGFVFEGIFRQHLVVKGRNRDTAWYSIIDREWPIVKAALEAWLAAENFDVSGRQRKSLASLRQALQPGLEGL